MVFKKVYVEITNVCNLHCSFCLKNNRNKCIMSKDSFAVVLNKLQGYTKYLYLHVLGEPLMHPEINSFIYMATDAGYFVNLTTNGYYIDKIKNNKMIRQINISLHSYVEGTISLQAYLDNIVNCVNVLKKHTYISYRLWVDTPYKKAILAFLEEYYQCRISENQKLDDHVFIAFENEFTWPSMDRPFLSNNGTCYALKSHIAVLSNGDVVPCCLDGAGSIKLGNLFDENLEDIIKSERYQMMLDGFKNNKKIEALCQRCDFIKKD